MKSCTNNFGGTKLSGEVSLGVRAEKRLNTTDVEHAAKLKAVHLRIVISPSCICVQFWGGFKPTFCCSFINEQQWRLKCVLHLRYFPLF
jgi:hypothetical protein